MQTTDLHAHIFPYDYYNDHPIDSVGLARTASLIAEIRAEMANSILLDNGDFLQGSVMGDYIAYDRGLKDGDLHPVIAAMNTLGYDAATLGNHEFNYGIPFLMAALGRSKFPFVSANALVKRGVDARKDKRLIPPYVLLDRHLRDAQGKTHPIRIGILGLLPPQIMTWDETLLSGKLYTRDMVETAEQLIPEMKEAGADIIVALAHTGIGEAQRRDGMENAAIPLARLRGLDALITGHTHQVFPSPQFAQTPEVDLSAGTIAGKPAVMAGPWGSHLGLIDLLLDRDGGTWKVVATRSEARPICLHGDLGGHIPLVKSDPRVLRTVQKSHDATLEYMRSPVGKTLRHLHSYFARVADCPSVQIVCQAQLSYVAEKLAGTPLAALPLLSAAAPFKAGGRTGPDNYTDIPAGLLFQRSVADLYSFPNTICALRLRGAEIAEWLERSAAAFNQIVPGVADQPLINAAFPSYNFDVIFGLTYEIDPSQPPRYDTVGALLDATARRVRNLCHQGQPIDPNAEFVVATNNYRASMQSAIAKSFTATAVFEGSMTIRTVIFNHIVGNGPLNLATKRNWRLITFPDTSYAYECSPRAIPHATEVNGLTLEPLAASSGGFITFRISG